MAADRDTGRRIAAAAQRLLGVPFRLHGRDPAIGIDCVGLVLLSVRAAGFQVAEPPPYRVRGGHATPAMRWLETLGLDRADTKAAGDIILADVSPIQTHLLIDCGPDCGGAMIHAHAGLGRVVEMAWPAQWRLVSRLRVAQGCLRVAQGWGD